jgi:cobalt-zinc-cadmium efflux system protein
VLSAHVVTDDVSISDGALLQRKVGELVARKYGIGHATVQLECEGCGPDVLFCDITENSGEKRDGTPR